MLHTDDSTSVLPDEALPQAQDVSLKMFWDKYKNKETQYQGAQGTYVSILPNMMCGNPKMFHLIS
jgi:hypothetical protein